MLEVEPTAELDLRPLEEADILDVNEAEQKAKDILRLADETETPALVVEDLYDEIADDEKTTARLFKGAGYTGRWDKIGLAEQIRRMDAVDWTTRLPFSPAGFIHTLNIIQAAKRLREDDYEKEALLLKRPAEIAAKAPGAWGTLIPKALSPSEYREQDIKLVEDYFLKQEEEQARGKSFGAKVFEGGTYLPAWMLEFVLTGGVAKLGNVTAKEVAAKTLQGYTKTKAGQAVLKAAGWTGSALTRATLAMPHRVATEAITRQMPKEMSFGPNGEFVFDINPESWEASIFKGWLSTVIEVASEQSGQGLTTGATILAGKLPFGGKVVAALAKLKPGESVQRFFTRAGWSNLLAEIGEERLATILHGICDTEDFGAGADANMLERLKAGITQDIQQFPVELAVLSLPSGVKYVGGKVVRRAPALAAVEKPTVLPTVPEVAEVTEFPKEAEEPARAADHIDLTTEKYPVQEMPVESLKLSKEVPQFKERAGRETGVIAGEELQGEYARLGTGAIVVWQRNNGDMEVITGRHRLDLAKRTGQETIPAQVVKESEGFTREMALTLDAESNIRDGQGSIKDYAHYFRTTEISETDARTQGLLSRVKGQVGFFIGKSAVDDVYTAFANNKLSEQKAYAIAKNAPGNDNAQRGALLKADKLSADELESYTQILSRLTPSDKLKATQGNLFGYDESALIEAEAIAKEVTKETDFIKDRILSVQGALRRPETARQMGLEFSDEPSIRKEVERLQNRLDDLSRVSTNPQLYREMRQRAGLEKSVVESVLERAEVVAPTEPAKPVEAQIQTQEESNQHSLDAAAVEATEASRQYLNEQPPDDLGAIEPTIEDTGFVRNLLHNLGIRDKGDYEPITTKDFHDIFKFVQMPFDVGLTFPQFSPIYEIQRAREAGKLNLDTHFAKALQPYFGLSAEDRKAVDAALCEADRNPAATYGPATLRKMGLSPAQMEGFLAARTAFDESLNILIDRMRAAGVEDEAIEDFMGKAGNYIPHKWYGSWAVVVREKKVELKRPRTLFMTVTNYMDRLKERERLHKLFPDDEVIVLQRNKIPYSAFQDAAPWAVGRMVDLVIERSQANPETAGAMKEALSDLYKSKGFGMHFIRRKNIPGYTEDLQRPIAEYFAGFNGYITKMQAIQQFSEALTAIRPDRTPNLYRYASDYIKYVTGEQPEFARAKRAAYTYYLFGNIKSATLNLTQNLTLGWPVLSKHTKVALPIMLQAQARTANSHLLTKAETQFIADLEKAGYLQPQLSTEISAYAGNPLFQGIRSKTGKVLSFMDIFRHAEGFNRRAMAVALYDAGITDIEQAGKMVEEAHFRYGKGNRPTLARGYISPVMTFRSWGINYFTWLKNEIKAGNIGPVAKSLAALTFLGGFSALPLASLFKWAWRKVFGSDPEADLRNAIGETAGQFAARGAPSLIGVSFTGSISPMDMPTPADVTTFEKTITELGGVFADVPVRAARISKDLFLKQYARAFEDALPEALRNPIAAYRLYEEGARTRSGRTILDLETAEPLKLMLDETVWKALGFQPVRLAEQWDIQKALDQFYGERMAKKQNWADRYWLAFLNDDSEEMDSITQEILDYNNKAQRRGRTEDEISVSEMDDMLQARTRPVNVPARGMLPKYQEILQKYYRGKAQKRAEEPKRKLDLQPLNE